MFTGIIECLGTVADIKHEGTNRTFFISAPFINELKVDQSVSHNGVCLTVTEINDATYSVTAVAETLAKTNLEQLEVGHIINLERCLPANGRFDGHFVQGHVDAQVTCLSIKELNGSWQFIFQFEPNYAPLLVEKGSIALNGVSLTVFNIGYDTFEVAIIPYTYHHTNFQYLQVGDKLNAEFDILGKYIHRHLQLRSINTE